MSLLRPKHKAASSAPLWNLFHHIIYEIFIKGAVLLSPKSRWGGVEKEQRGATPFFSSHLQREDYLITHAYPMALTAQSVFFSLSLTQGQPGAAELWLGCWWLLVFFFFSLCTSSWLADWLIPSLAHLEQETTPEGKHRPAHTQALPGPFPKRLTTHYTVLYMAELYMWEKSIQTL